MMVNSSRHRDGFANDVPESKPKRGRYGKPIPLRPEHFIDGQFPRWIICEHPWHAGAQHGTRRRPPQTSYLKRWILSEQEIVEAFLERDFRSLEQPPMIICQECAQLEEELFWKPPKPTRGWVGVHLNFIERERSAFLGQRILPVPAEVLEAVHSSATRKPTRHIRRWFERDFFVWAVKKIAFWHHQANERRRHEEEAYGTKTAYYQVLADFLAFIVAPEPQTARPSGHSSQH